MFFVFWTHVENDVECTEQTTVMSSCMKPTLKYLRVSKHILGTHQVCKDHLVAGSEHLMHIMELLPTLAWTLQGLRLTAVQARSWHMKPVKRGRCKARNLVVAAAE
eukprot:2215519-Amphidinium_carterae.1